MRYCSLRAGTRLLTSAAGALLLPTMLLTTGPASAQNTFTATSAITLPGHRLITSFDISYVDPVIGLYILADRTNKSVDVIDTQTNTVQVQLRGGFVGFTGNNDTSGPNGALIVNHREVWAGDGKSELKIFDLFSQKLTHTIDLGGKFRADELCVDPRDNVVLIANDAEHDNPAKWPFVTFVSTDTYQILGKLVMNGQGNKPKATGGIEQCQWSMDTGMFYLNIPEVNGPGNDSVDGAVLVIDPTTMRIVKSFDIPVNKCGGPQGMALGPDTQILLGCHVNASAVINTDGVVLKSFRNEFGSDEAWYNPGDGHYFLGENANTTSRLGVIDANVPNVGPVADPSPPTGGSAHSVAADPVMNQVYVPIPSGAPFGVCSSAGGSDAQGCIAVFTATSPHTAAN